MSESTTMQTTSAEEIKETWLTTRLESVVNWGRKNSLWPLPFGTACCAIEFMSLMTSRYDFSRFGAEAMRFSPRQSDMMLVLGTITNKQAAVIRKIFAQMADPKWVVCVGACASTGGIYRTYATVQGIDRIIPVDIYVPGCPPRPEAIIKGVVELQEQMMQETFRSREGNLRAFYRSLERQQTLENTGMTAQKAIQQMFREAADAGQSRIW
ncbi:MAG: NADH-quinone oxidoreductase subunit NuoB [Holophagaceae bacterium]|nr:NADH-quinone oxidoreductase subunit NuoB [Holophagaceae bacterium]